MKEANHGGKIFFVDTTLRDGQLSLWASNMRTAMMLPIAERLDQAGFEAIEIMSSAFYKKCVRDLKDDPCSEAISSDGSPSAKPVHG